MVLVNAACGPASPLIHSDPLTGLQRDFHQLQRFNENMHVEMLTLRAVGSARKQQVHGASRCSEGGGFCHGP